MAFFLPELLELTESAGARLAPEIAETSFVPRANLLIRQGVTVPESLATQVDNSYITRIRNKLADAQSAASKNYETWKTKPKFIEYENPVYRSTTTGGDVERFRSPSASSASETGYARGYDKIPSSAESGSDFNARVPQKETLLRNNTMASLNRAVYDQIPMESLSGGSESDVVFKRPFPKPSASAGINAETSFGNRVSEVGESQPLLRTGRSVTSGGNRLTKAIRNTLNRFRNTKNTPKVKNESKNTTNKKTKTKNKGKASENTIPKRVASSASEARGNADFNFRSRRQPSIGSISSDVPTYRWDPVGAEGVDQYFPEEVSGNKRSKRGNSSSSTSNSNKRLPKKVIRRTRGERDRAYKGKGAKVYRSPNVVRARSGNALNNALLGGLLYSDVMRDR